MAFFSIKMLGLDYITQKSTLLKMKSFVLLLLASCFYFQVPAQMIYSLQDPVRARSFSAVKYSGVRGTPFINEDWLAGSVTTTRGIYQNLQLKYNVYDNLLIFQQNDEAYEMTDQIVGFTLKPAPADSTTFMIFKNGISGSDIRPSNFVQVLAEGKASLYKMPAKQMAEVTEVNAGMVKVFANNNKYYLSVNNNLQRVQLKKADILQALADKADKLEVFIKDKKLSFKKEADLLVLIQYYNLL